MNGNSIINEIGGVAMKTIGDIKPVIDNAVEGASRIRDEIAMSKDDIVKGEPEMESTISVQDIPVTPDTSDIKATETREQHHEKENDFEKNDLEF